MSDRVLIYRSEFLAFSETFIAAQAEAMRSYTPVFVGLRRVNGSLTPRVKAWLLSHGDGWLDRARRYAFRTAGYAPKWITALRKQQAALVHAHFAPDAAEALPLVRSLGIPLVVTLHGYDVMASDDVHRRSRRGRLYLKRRQQLFTEARLFLCVSEAIRLKAIERGFPPEKLLLHSIGTDLSQFTPSEQLAQEPIILFVGRLVEKKGCIHLIRAMREVQRTLPSARLIVIGSGPERAALEAEARRSAPDTLFLGVQSGEQVRHWMASSRVLAVPSITARDGDAEGLPTVLGEALAMGLPVACFRSAGIPEMVRDDVEGLLSDEGDEAELACSLLRLCEDDELASRLRSAGRQRVEESFDLAAQTRKLESIYTQVLAEKGEGDQRRTLSPRQGGPELEEGAASPAPSAEATSARRVPRLRHQAAWMISGNGVAVIFQAIYFVLVGRMLGSREYGAIVGVGALVNVLSQFSSLGMEMILVRNISRDRASFAVTWGKALAVSGVGFLVLLAVSTAYAHLFLAPGLMMLVPWMAVADGLLGKVAQLASRALQGADHAAWSARLTALTNGTRALIAGLMLVFCLHGHRHASALLWVRVYWLASLTVAIVGVVVVTRLLGLPRFTRLSRRDLGEGLSFSLSSSSISAYNDIDKTLLVSLGQSYAAGIYSAAYRVVDVLTTPIYSLYAAASPRFFREGAAGVASAERFSRRMLRWTVPFGIVAAIALAVFAPMLPFAFGRSFTGSVTVLRWLCLLPLIRGLQYAWGTTITASSSQWLRTATQGGAALLNLSLNLVLIPRWSWQGAAVASLITDGALALSNGLLVMWLLGRHKVSQVEVGPAHKPHPA